MNVSSPPLAEVAAASRLTRLPSTSMSRRISPLQASMLMLRLRLTRLHNRLLGGGGANARSTGRPGSAPRWLGLAFTLCVGLPLLTGWGILLGRFLPGVYRAGADGAIPTASAHLAVSMFGALLLSLGMSNKDLNRLDGDMEWLLTLPVPIPSLYTMKVVERTLLNVYSWVQIYPMLLAMVTHGEFSWLGAVQALLLSLPLMLLVALAYVVVECGARVWLPKLMINSLQFAATVGGLALLMLIPTRPHWVAPLAAVPWPAVSQAVSLASSSSVSASGASISWHILRYVVETAALLGAGYLVLLHIAARGAVVGAGAAQGRRGAGSRPAFERETVARGMVKKELLQLLRDKKTLYMALMLPGVVVFQLFVLAQGSRGERLFASTSHLPALAFLAGAMPVLIVSNLLHAEGKALWLLFTLPRSLARMLAERALVWVPVCLGFAALVLAFGLRHQPLSRELVSGSAYCFVGLTLLVLIGAALGLNTVDPHAIENERNSTRGGPQVLLLCVLLAAFGSGFYGDAWLRLSLSVLLMAIAYGVWQDAGRRLPYLLEPELRPAPCIGVSDGLVCVLLVMLLQLFGAQLAEEHLQLRALPARALGFVAAISVVGAGAAVLFWRRGLRDIGGSLGVTWGTRPRAALQQGLYWAVPSVVTAVASVLVVGYWPALRAWNQAAQAQSSLVQPGDWLSLFLLTCVAAPCAEELLFRGMIYRGLRESLSPRASALFTASVFAAIHPLSAALPVFLLSLFATTAFERSRSLAPPLIVHVAYNGTLLLAAALSGA